MSGIFIDPTVRIPISIEQGDSVSWTDDPFYDYTGATYGGGSYTLTYTILPQIGNKSAPLSVAATPVGAGWLTQMTTQQTAALVAGTCLWQATLSATNYQGTVARGTLEVIMNLAQAGAGYD